MDILSLKRRVPTFTLDCTDAFHQAPELGDVVVEPPEEYLNRLRVSWHVHKHLVEAAETIAGSTSCWSRLGRSFHVCVSGQTGIHEVT